jgi:hypothetical protein
MDFQSKKENEMHESKKCPNYGQSPPKYAKGDYVTLINDYGVVFTDRKIVGVEKWDGYDEFRYFVEPSCSPWYSHKESSLYGKTEDPVVEVVAGHKIRHTNGWNEAITKWLDYLVVGNSLAIFHDQERAREFALANPTEEKAEIAEVAA